MHVTQQSYFLLQRIISNKALFLKYFSIFILLIVLILFQIQFPYLSYQASTLLRLWGSQLGAIGAPGGHGMLYGEPRAQNLLKKSV